MSRAPDAVLLPALRGELPPAVAPDDLARWLPSFRDHGLAAIAGRAAAARGLTSPELMTGAGVQEAWTRLNLGVARETARRLDADRIPFLFFKGVAMALTVYDPPELRTFGDVDLFVPPDHLQRAYAAIEAIGFERNVDHVSNPMERDFKREEAPGVTVWIDLHWDFTGDEALQAPMRMNAAEILSRARRVDGIPIPSDEDSLVIAGSNLIRSTLDRLILIADFARLSTRPLDWEAVQSRAAAWGLKTSLWIGLMLAQEHLQAKVPERTMTFLAPSAWKVAWIRSLLTPERLCRTNKLNDLRYRHLLKALCLDSAGDVMRMIAALPKGLVKKLGAGRSIDPTGS